jgi:hypothetical protein
MASLIVSSPSFAARGFALTEHSAVEQSNGLLEARVRYVTTVANRDQFAARFFPDAPPPIHPPCVNASELVTGRLYMVNRSISQANGLVTVDAEYAGAWQRQGASGYYLTQDRTGPFKGSTIYSIGSFELGEVTIFFNDIPATRIYNFDYYINETVVEYAQVGNTPPLGLPTFGFEDLFVFLKLTGAFGANASIQHGQDIIFGSQLSIFPAGVVLPARPETLIKDVQEPKPVEEPAIFITPTVRIKKIRYAV